MIDIYLKVKCTNLSTRSLIIRGVSLPNAISRTEGIVIMIVSTNNIRRTVVLVHVLVLVLLGQFAPFSSRWVVRVQYLGAPVSKVDCVDPTSDRNPIVEILAEDDQIKQ
jgi:hypothetical protein